MEEEGEEDDVDRERCWYVKEGLFVTKSDWGLMIRLGWREGGNGIAMKYQMGIEVEWNEKGEERRKGDLFGHPGSIIPLYV